MESITLEGFQGMIQRQDPDKIPDGCSPLLLNISNDKPGTWGKRKGSIILGDPYGGSNAVLGLIDYLDPDGTYALTALRGGNTEVYDDISDAWAIIDTGSSTSSDKLSSVNFKGRKYHIGENTFLFYETGAGKTEVGSGASRIKGQGLAVMQNTLWVLSGSKVYYSYADPDTGELTDQLWNPGQTLATSSRFIDLPSRGKAIIAYAPLESIVIFTSRLSLTYDLRYAANVLGPKTLFDKGCVNQRAVCISNNYLVWMDRSKRIWAWGGSGEPSNLSYDIDDDEYKSAIINNILSGNLQHVCCGVVGNKFYFSVRNITYRGTLYENVLIRGLWNQNFSSVLWGIETYPYIASIFETCVLGGEEVLAMGCTNGNVYLMNVGTDDTGVAVDASGRTKFFDWQAEHLTKEYSHLNAKYKPQSTSETYLRIGYAKDGNYSYTAITDPENSIRDNGIINMNAGYSVTQMDGIQKIGMPPETKSRNISFEIGNNQLSQDFELSKLLVYVGRTSLLEINPNG